MNSSEIKSLRKRLRLTQKALADAIGVRSNTVARWERGELGISLPMVEHLRAVAESLPSGAAITRLSGVILDPHHRAILDELKGKLDPTLFEACAAELLQSNWPRIVAVRGGRDDGFDGSVADGSPYEPFPLIVTTGQDLVGNLRRSLDSAQRSGWKPQRALLATSRRITPATRRKLYEAARGKGVLLYQAYDQDWFASSLYRNPEWCKRLLGVTGRPHALSVYPVTQRALLCDAIFGREREMQWVLDHRGDCLLVGEPGSGKTFLLRSLALQGEALFLVDKNREQIANDLRSLKPNAVIVDDAHVHPEEISELKQLRCGIDADFRIIATCWPGETAKVRTTLGTGRQDELELDRIDADTVIEIIKSIGLAGPDQLLYVIRKQAAGRPGLAATLAHLCLVGDIRDAVSGEGLVDAVAPGLDKFVGADAIRVLAPFALGGNAGVKQEYVAERLGLSLLDISGALAKLGTAGIITERPNSAVSVEPPPMRWALVRRVFYGNAGSLPVDLFLSKVSNPADALDTLIGARVHGAHIPDLEQRLEQANSTRLWSKYASLGSVEASCVLDRHPELIADVAESALRHVPEKVIPMLLDQAKDKAKPVADPWAATQSTLDLLNKWITETSLAWDAALNRRRRLVESARTWWWRSQNAQVAIAAMCIAFNPVHRSATPDPGSGQRIRIKKGTLTAGEIDRLTEFWPVVMSVVSEAGDIPWRKLLELAQNWSSSPLEPTDSAPAAARHLFRRMLEDLAKASRQYPGVQHRLGDLASHAGTEVEVELNPDFEHLYPPMRHDLESWKRQQVQHKASARHMAAQWSNRPGSELATFLGRMEAEARRADLASLPNFLPEFCRSAAEDCPDPVVTARAFMQERISANLVEPFVRKALEGEQPQWPLVTECLNDSTYTTVGIDAAIARPGHPPPELVSLALAAARNVPNLIKVRCQRREVSESMLMLMLTSGDPRIALPAAIGLWQPAGLEPSDEPFREAWQKAVLLSTASERFDHFWIVKILERDSGLASEWLIRLLNQERIALGYHAEESAVKIAGKLNEEHRRNVLASINGHPPEVQNGVAEIVQALVGDDLDLYREVLSSEALEPYHLAPLIGRPNDGWCARAVLALDHGYPCHDLVGAALVSESSGWGSESDMWAGWRRAFEAVEQAADPRVASVCELGARMAGKRENASKQRERREAVNGIF